MAKVIDEKDLLGAASDLHKRLELDVSPEGLNDKDLLEYVKQASGLLQPGDDLEARTLETMRELEIDIPAGVTERGKKEVKKMASKKEKEAAPKVEAKAAPKAEAKAAEPVKEAKVKPAPKPPKEKKERYVREFSIVEALGKRKYHTFEELAEHGNKIYVEHDGHDNLNQSKLVLKAMLITLKRIGYVTVNDKGQLTKAL